MTTDGTNKVTIPVMLAAQSDIKTANTHAPTLLKTKGLIVGGSTTPVTPAAGAVGACAMFASTTPSSGGSSQNGTEARLSGEPYTVMSAIAVGDMMVLGCNAPLNFLPVKNQGW